jgi:hypothetical protein
MHQKIARSSDPELRKVREAGVTTSRIDPTHSRVQDPAGGEKEVMDCHSRGREVIILAVSLETCLEC